MVGGGRLAAALLGLLGIRAATTLLTPEQYGQLALLLVVQTFCGLLLINPVGMHINRHTHAWWDDGSLLSRLREYRKYVLAVSILGGVAALFVAAGVPAIQRMASVPAMLLMVFGATWNATWIPLLNMVGQRGAAVRWSLVSSLLGLLLSVLLCAIWPVATAWFIGQAGGLLLGASGAERVLRRLVPHQNERQFPPLLDRQTLMLYCLPLGLGTGLMWLQSSGYRLVVEHYWGLAPLGYFSLGLLLATQIWALAEALAQQFFMPLFYRRIAQAGEEGKSAALSDLLNVMVPLYLVLAGMTYLGAPHLVKLLVASRFAEVELFVRLGVGIEFCRVTANLLVNAAHANQQTRSMILPYALGASMALAAVALAGEGGLAIHAVSVALLLAALLMLCVMWLTMSREVRLVVDAKRWLLAGGVLLLFGLSSLWVPYPVGWGAAMLVLLGIGVAGGVAMAGLLRGSPALRRWLQVDLVKQGGAG